MIRRTTSSSGAVLRPRSPWWRAGVRLGLGALFCAWLLLVVRLLLPPVDLPVPDLRLRDLVVIPARTVTVPGGQPSEVPAFLLDRFEVTEEEYAAFLAANPEHPAPVDGAPRPGSDLPVVRVTYRDAEAFAAWEGRRLPTLAEWVAAARGSEAQAFPWGAGLRALAANTPELGLGERAPVGLLENGRSVDGLYDLVGNVAEWSATRGGVFRNERHFIAGGSYLGPSLRDAMELHYRTTDPPRWVPHEDKLRGPTSWADDLGFRTALDLDVMSTRRQIETLLPRLAARDPLGWWLEVRPARERLRALDAPEVARALRQVLDSGVQGVVRERLQALLEEVSS